LAFTRTRLSTYETNQRSNGLMASTTAVEKGVTAVNPIDGETQYGSGGRLAKKLDESTFR